MTPVQIIHLTETEKVGRQRIIFNIFQLTTTEAMSSYEGQFVKIGLVFHALYLESKDGDPPVFFRISDIGDSLSDCSKSMKKKLCCRRFSRERP